MTTLTSPDNLVKWTTSDSASIVAPNNQLADSVQAALLLRAAKSYTWANKAARDAQTGMAASYTGYQTDISIYWYYDGTRWNPMTITEFASLSVVSTQIPSPVTGMRVRVTGIPFDYQYSTTWRPAVSSYALVPTIAGTGGTSAVDSYTGAVTFSGALTAINVYIPTASISLINTAKYVDITFGYTGSSSGTLTAGLLDGGGTLNSASSYYADYHGAAGAAALNDNRAVATIWSNNTLAARRRMRFDFRAFNLAVAQPTEMLGKYLQSDTGTTNRMLGTATWVHEVSTAFTGIRLLLAGFGTISNGLVTMKAHY